MNRNYISGIIDVQGRYLEDRGKPLIRVRVKDLRILNNLRKYFNQEEKDSGDDRGSYLFELRGKELINQIDELSIILGKNENFSNWVKKYPELVKNIIPV